MDPYKNIPAYTSSFEADAGLSFLRHRSVNGLSQSSETPNQDINSHSGYGLNLSLRNQEIGCDSTIPTGGPDTAHTFTRFGRRVYKMHGAKAYVLDSEDEGEGADTSATTVIRKAPDTLRPAANENERAPTAGAAKEEKKEKKKKKKKKGNDPLRLKRINAVTGETDDEDDADDELYALSDGEWLPASAVRRRSASKSLARLKLFAPSYRPPAKKGRRKQAHNKRAKPSSGVFSPETTTRPSGQGNVAYTLPTVPAETPGTASTASSKRKATSSRYMQYDETPTKKPKTASGDRRGGLISADGSHSSSSSSMGLQAALEPPKMKSIRTHPRAVEKGPCGEEVIVISSDEDEDKGKMKVKSA